MNRTPIPPPGSLSRKRNAAFSNADWMLISQHADRILGALLAKSQAVAQHWTALAPFEPLGWLVGPSRIIVQKDEFGFVLPK
jgi:hypothetical protein